MRRRIILFAAAVFISCALFGCASGNKVKLTTQEIAEINDWMYSAKTLYTFGDYTLAKYYCEKVIERYPDTSYARKAKSLSRSVEWKVKYK